MIRSILAIATIASLGLAIYSARAQDAAAAPAAPALPTTPTPMSGSAGRAGRMHALPLRMRRSLPSNGTLTHEAFHPAKNPPIDCFYVYPTVSTEPGGNSDLNITGAEKSGGECAVRALRCQVPLICTHVSASDADRTARDDCGQAHSG